MADNANKSFSATVGGVKIEAPSQEALDRLVQAAFASARPAAPPPPSAPVAQQPAQPAADPTPKMDLNAFIAEIQGTGGLRGALKAGLGFDILERMQQQQQLIQTLSGHVVRDRMEHTAQRLGFELNRASMETLSNTAVRDFDGDYSLGGLEKAARKAIDNGWIQARKPEVAKPVPQMPGALEGGDAGKGVKGPDVLDGTIEVDLDGNPEELLMKAYAEGRYDDVDAITAKLMAAQAAQASVA